MDAEPPARHWSRPCADPGLVASGGVLPRAAAGRGDVPHRLQVCARQCGQHRNRRFPSQSDARPRIRAAGCAENGESLRHYPTRLRPARLSRSACWHGDRLRAQSPSKLCAAPSPPPMVPGAGAAAVPVLPMAAAEQLRGVRAHALGRLHHRAHLRARRARRVFDRLRDRQPAVNRDGRRWRSSPL
jgi:hypothetical protein